MGLNVVVGVRYVVMLDASLRIGFRVVGADNEFVAGCVLFWSVSSTVAILIDSHNPMVLFNYIISNKDAGPTFLVWPMVLF